MNIDIPQRAKNEADFPQLKVLDKRIIAYAVLCQTSNEEAFMRFHPEYLRADGKGMNDAGKTESKHFWSYGKNREYRQAYEATVEEFFNRNTEVATDEDIETIDGDALARKILSDLSAMVKNGRIQDYEVLKIVTDILNKYGLLKGSEEKQIAPLRFLPLCCWGDGCRYRLFCESMVLEGSAIDECQFCKARAKAEELGYKFKDTELLNIPEDVVKRLEEKNNVKLEDIISGRVPN